MLADPSPLGFPSVPPSPSAFSGPIVLEALFLTALITVSLTAYTFWAAKRGQDFESLGPSLFTALLALVGVSFIQVRPTLTGYNAFTTQKSTVSRPRQARVLSLHRRVRLGGSERLQYCHSRDEYCYNTGSVLVDCRLKPCFRAAIYQTEHLPRASCQPETSSLLCCPLCHCVTRSPGPLQMFFPFGSLGTALVAGAGAVVFSLYIVYDTSNILQRFSYDDYIWASLALYLDIINLFSYLLELLSALQGDRN